MDMKYMVILQLKQFNKKYIPVIFLLKYFTKEEIVMLKFLAKTAEKYAKATNTACATIWLWHQPKMPASMIKKG